MLDSRPTVGASALTPPQTALAPVLRRQTRKVPFLHGDRGESEEGREPGRPALEHPQLCKGIKVSGHVLRNYIVYLSEKELWSFLSDH